MAGHNTAQPRHREVPICNKDHRLVPSNIFGLLRSSTHRNQILLTSCSSSHRKKRIKGKKRTVRRFYEEKRI